MSWGMMIQTLVQNGHRLEDVLEYTMGQIGVFLKSIYEIKNEESIAEMFSIRAAVWAEEKDFKDITKSSKVQASAPKAPNVPDSWVTK